MRRLALFLAIAASLALPAAALAGGTLRGTYKTKVNAAGQFTGTWTLNIMPGGKYTILLNDALLVRGTWTNRGSTITFGQESGAAACVPSAKYSWKRTGKTLKLTKIKDSATLCAGRILVLSHVFTRVIAA
jgi:hypothetical protein